MSLPPISTQKNSKGLSTNANTGIGQKARTSNALLNSSSSGPDQLPTNNENFLHGQMQKNFPVLVGPLSDESQMRYSKYDILFSKNPTELKPEENAYIYALQNLNFALERTQRNFLQNEKALETRGEINLGETEEDFDPTRSSNLKRKYPIALNLDRFPMSATEFAQAIHHIGSMWSHNDKRGVRKRVLGVTVEGRTTIANIFGPCSVGDTVGLVVKQVNNPYNQLIDLDGRAVGAPTPGRFLQIRGYYDSESEIPIHSTKFGDPQDKDLDYWDYDGFVRTRSVGTKTNANGVTTLNWDNAKNGTGVNISQKVTKVPLYQEGFYIPLGRVEKVNRPPTQDLMDLAVRSFQHYGKLLGESSIEVELDPNPCNQIYRL